MRKYLFLIFVLAAPYLFSQTTYFSAGMSYTILRNKNVNKIFARYNDNGFGHFEPYNSLYGPIFSFDFRGEDIMGTMGFAMRKKNITAVYYNSQNLKHEITCTPRYGYWFLNFYWHFVDEDRFKMGPGFGGAISMYRFQKSAIIDGREYDPYDILQQTHFLSSILFNMSVYIGENFSINIQPYFQAPFLFNTMVHYAPLENDLNPAYTIPDDDWDSYDEWQWNYGVTLSLSVGGE